MTTDTQAPPATENGAEASEKPSQARRPTKKQHCRFFATKKGCRAGDSCPFLHEAREGAQRKPHDVRKTTTQSKTPQAASTSEAANIQPQKSSAQVSQPVREVDSSRVVQRPVAANATRDPKTFQINQIKTRFAAKEEDSAEGFATYPQSVQGQQSLSHTSLTFSMVPSDPDFPFDIEGGLQCVLQIPSGFPKQKPSLRVMNKEMERGYQINVERGFDIIWAESTNSTLLNAMKALDRQLEAILTGRKADTIKLVVNRGATNRQDVPKVEVAQPTSQAPSHATISSHPKPPLVSLERQEQARKKRQLEVQALKHRLGRDPLFSEAAGGTIFSVPFEPRKRDSLPTALKAIKTIRLYVPDTYDVEPCSIELLGVEGQEAINVERAFSQRVMQMSEMSLMAHLNYLTQNIHAMTTDLKPEKAISAPAAAAEIIEEVRPSAEKDKTTYTQKLWEQPDDRHIKVIPRPVEWDLQPAKKDGEESSEESSDYSTFDEDSGDEVEEDIVNNNDQSTGTPREKGIMLSLPHLELYNIELLELNTLNLTVKCERCKDITDVSQIKPNDRNDHAGMRQASCKKCTNPFAVGWRKDLMHANSIRAGYLDLEGCTIVDLLPSNFIPTCSECSTSYPAPGVVAVRGDSAIAMCRECHKKMNFKLPEVKFLAVGSAQQDAARSLPRKKPKENLGIVAGQELPSRGRCTHYRKSYRWFRFSCCMKVFPCDRCHDAATDHLNEFANRMICGFCSREQNYRPEDCGICHSNLVGRRRTAFWEGGTGTRDQKKMSRKDPRKYKRIGTSATKKS